MDAEVSTCATGTSDSEVTEDEGDEIESPALRWYEQASTAMSQTASATPSDFGLASPEVPWGLYGPASTAMSTASVTSSDFGLASPEVPEIMQEVPWNSELVSTQSTYVTTEVLIVSASMWAKQRLSSDSNMQAEEEAFAGFSALNGSPGERVSAVQRLPGI